MVQKIIGVIPARYASTRFPGKPLHKICNKPMIQWVWEAASKSGSLQDVIVATDDERIYDCVQAFGGHAVMTGECSCGTERVYEVVKDTDCDIVINIQGDEPLIKPTVIDALADGFIDSDVQMATMKRKIVDPGEIENPNVVKVISDINQNAIYFSRYAIPYQRNKNMGTEYWAHIGIYAYRKAFLEQYVSLKQSSLEQAEQLEQLRVLENGYSIRVLETDYVGYGIDTPEDAVEMEKFVISVN